MTASIRLRLGTRASALARWQADWVAVRLKELGVEVELVLITTEGDVAAGPLGQVGGQGLFTKRIQQALLDNEIDVAVHSLKDLPTDAVAGLTIAAVPERESASDVLVTDAAADLVSLPRGARVGTGSMRRRAQLLHHRSDLQILDIRGNVDTRLRKLDEGQYDAIILAEAGLKRLGLQDRITQVLPHSLMLPAIGQGALGIEAREDDAQTLSILNQLDDASTRSSVLAERAMLATLRGGCLAPVGAWGRVQEGQVILDGVVLSGDGSQRLAATASGSPDAPQSVGNEVAQKLLDDGAQALIVASRSAN